jgi:hypothetical protein
MQIDRRPRVAVGTRAGPFIDELKVMESLVGPAKHRHPGRASEPGRRARPFG